MRDADQKVLVDTDQPSVVVIWTYEPIGLAGMADSSVTGVPRDS